MAFKLPTKELSTLIAKIDSIRSDLDLAQTDFQADIGLAWAQFQPKLDAWNEVANEANTWISEIAGDLRVEFEERSEKWQDSERGQAVSNWLDELESFDLETVEVEMPDFSCDIPDNSLENLPDTAEEA